jgi:predicted DNA-binding transcriptional regulator YafY
MASKNVAIYFQKDMKKFFPSQRYIQKYENGEIEFSVEYTNDMEILPFIKKWLPEISIIEPLDLKSKLHNDIAIALNL